MADMDWEDAVDFADTLLERIKELPEEAEDFANGVMETVEGIRGNMATAEYASERQITALENIKGGVDKWMRD